MPNPRDLFSRARRPVRAPEPPPAPPAPVQFGTTIERRTYDPSTGEVTIYRFDPQRGETVEVVPASDVQAPAFTDAQREGARITAAVIGR